jgi:HlyD family secretion protein
MRKVITLLLVLVLLVGGFFVVRYFQEQQQASSLSQLQTEIAAQGNLTASVGATGSVRANQTALLTWKTNGLVEEVLVESGESIEAGASLVSLNSSSLPQSIIMAQADLITAQKTLDNLLNTQITSARAAQAVIQAEKAVIEAERALALFDARRYIDEFERAERNIETMRDRLTQAETNFELYKDLDEDNANYRLYKSRLEDAQYNYNEAVRTVSLLELDQEIALSTLNFAQAQLADAQREYERLKNGPDPDEIAALEARIAAAEATLELARMTAPFAGTVTMVEVKPGAQAVTGQLAFRIDDLNSLLVDTRVSEVDINRISLGQQATLSFDAIPGRDYQGFVRQVSKVGNAVQGIVEFIVTIELTNSDEFVKPGMTAGVNIVVKQIENVLLVPNRAVRIHEGQRVVYVLREATMDRVAVTLGSSSDMVSEVVSGELRVGDEIILNPPTSFLNSGPGFMGRR